MIWVALFAVLCLEVAGLSFRGTAIHIGAMFGTYMAFNVWFRIWPAQQRIITAIKNGDASEPGDPADRSDRSSGAGNLDRRWR